MWRISESLLVTFLMMIQISAFSLSRSARPSARGVCSGGTTDVPLKSAVFDRGWDGNFDDERAAEAQALDALKADEEFIRLRNEIRNPDNSELNKRYASIIPLTVSILRREYGTRANWWGDLTASEARLLYWRLLPTVMLLEEEFEGLPLKDRAYIASMARYAAKLYARERSMVPERAAAAVYDGTRYALKTGRWSPTGMSVEEIWLKYEREVKEELSADAVTEDELYRRLYQRILRKSCSTNPFIDAVCRSDSNAMKNGRPWPSREKVMEAMRHAVRALDSAPLSRCSTSEQSQRVLDLLRVERAKHELGARLGPDLRSWVRGANAKLVKLLAQIDAKEQEQAAARAEFKGTELQDGPTKNES